MLTWDIFLFYGIILGITIAYFLRGTGIYTLNNLLREFIQDDSEAEK